MVEEKWNELKGESNMWIPQKEGSEVQGVIISMMQQQYGIQVIIEDKDHRQITLPSHKVLQSRIKDCKVGELIKVVFVKQELPKVRGQNPTNIYKIYKKEES